jgi:hypothetical protein
MTPESDMSVLTPTLCMNGRESSVCTFCEVLPPSVEHAMAHSNTKKHPIANRDEMRELVVLRRELSVSMGVFTES